MGNILEVKDLCKTYVIDKRQNNVLRNVSLNVEEGDMVAIMGPSGSGKSTLLYSVSGMDLATSGSVLFDGQDIMKLDKNTLAKKLSKKLEVPPYVIFQDPSLEAMATIYPVTLDELQNIPGVGAGKAKRYGEEFCKLIKRHCEENEIERPEDLRVRTVANKSKMKVAIIQAVDRKVALDDIALSKGIEFGDLLDEIEAIVYSGTKLNIDYFLDEIMDEDHMLDIYDYFKESTTDKIDDALDELGDDFTEEEVRLVRIKFISEMAN